MADDVALSLRFRPLDRGDAAFVHELHGDPQTNVHNPFGASPDLAASEQLLAGWVEHWQQQGFGYELAFAGERLVGICGARDDRWARHPVINLYWRLLPQFWGKGLGDSLGRCALNLALASRRRTDELIVARMLPENAASARIAERIGLVRRADLDGQMDGAFWILYVLPVPDKDRV